MLCGTWKIEPGRFEERLQASVPGQPKVFLATTVVAEAKLPQGGKTIVFYGKPNVLAAGYWLWLKDSRDIAATR